MGPESLDQSAVQGLVWWDCRNYPFRSQTSSDSTVRVLSLSRFCPDVPENRVRCLSAVLILPEFSVRFLSVPVLSAVRIIEKSCPLSVCPAGQGRDRAVRTFTVRRRLSVPRTRVMTRPCSEFFKVKPGQGLMDSTLIVPTARPRLCPDSSEMPDEGILEIDFSFGEWCWILVLE